MGRGRIYGALTGRYGEKVEVRGSSCATEAQCWLDIDSAVNKNDYMGGERKDADALLTVQQAIVLRAALDSFIADATGDGIDS